MSGHRALKRQPYVVDNVVLAMFVDAGRAELLSEVGAGQVFVPPSILDPQETPPFVQQPTAEFARGAFSLQQRMGLPFEEVRLSRRMAFYLDQGKVWQPVLLSVDELRETDNLLNPATWALASVADASVRVKRIDRGEAECAAVAIARNGTLWTDDAAIVALLSSLYPDQPVERISDLLVRGVEERLISCSDAAMLYNVEFKDHFSLWTTLTLGCDDERLVRR